MTKLRAPESTNRHQKDSSPPLGRFCANGYLFYFESEKSPRLITTKSMKSDVDREIANCQFRRQRKVLAKLEVRFDLKQAKKSVTSFISNNSLVFVKSLLENIVFHFVKIFDGFIFKMNRKFFGLFKVYFFGRFYIDENLRFEFIQKLVFES